MVKRDLRGLITKLLIKKEEKEVLYLVKWHYIYILTYLLIISYDLKECTIIGVEILYYRYTSTFAGLKPSVKLNIVFDKKLDLTP